METRKWTSNLVVAWEVCANVNGWVAKGRMVSKKWERCRIIKIGELLFENNIYVIISINEFMDNARMEDILPARPRIGCGVFGSS